MDLDVVSGGELAIATSVNFPPERIHFHGNNKSEDELREALDYGIAPRRHRQLPRDAAS